MGLRVEALRTRIFHRGDSLEEFLRESLQGRSFEEKSILAITSKIVSLAENRTVGLNEISKIDLIRQEADHFLGEINHGTRLTIKHHLLIPAAGIDESNAEGEYYILFPEDPFASAEKILQVLKKITGLNEIGVVITDSHSMPLRLGVVGIGLAYAGFSAIQDKVGEPDLFGRPLRITKMNVLDGIAVSAVMMMGEAAEQCPLAWISGAPVNFVSEVRPEEILVPMEEDLYYPLYEFLMKRNP